MDSLSVVCDDCFGLRGIRALKMSGPRENLLLIGPGMRGPLEDTYQCPGCSRYYSVVLGYFSMDKGVSRNRTHPHCHQPDCRFEPPMYIKAPAMPDGLVTFACPACKSEEQHLVSFVPHDSWRAA
jgi:hypothetical protein